MQLLITCEFVQYHSYTTVYLCVHEMEDMIKEAGKIANNSF